MRVRKEPFQKGSGKAKCNELIFSSLLLCAAVTTGKSVYFVNSALLKNPVGLSGYRESYLRENDGSM